MTRSPRLLALLASLTLPAIAAAQARPKPDVANARYGPHQRNVLVALVVYLEVFPNKRFDRVPDRQAIVPHWIARQHARVGDTAAREFGRKSEVSDVPVFVEV